VIEKNVLKAGAGRKKSAGFFILFILPFIRRLTQLILNHIFSL